MKVMWVRQMVVGERRTLLPPWPMKTEFDPVALAIGQPNLIPALIELETMTGCTRAEAAEVLAAQWLNWYRQGVEPAQAWWRVVSDQDMIYRDWVASKSYEQLHPGTVAPMVIYCVVVVGIVLVVYYLHQGRHVPNVRAYGLEKDWWFGLGGDGQVWRLWPVAYRGRGRVIFVSFGSQPATWCVSHVRGVATAVGRDMDRVYFGSSLTSRSWSIPWFWEWNHLYWDCVYCGIGRRMGSTFVSVGPSTQAAKILDEPFTRRVADAPERPFWCPGGLDWVAVLDWWLRGGPFPW